MFVFLLLLIDLLVLAVCAVFTVESTIEKEPRAPRVGFTGVIFHLLLVPIIIWIISFLRTNIPAFHYSIMPCGIPRR